MNPDLALIGARFLEIGATLALVGAAWFPLFAIEPGQDWPKGLVGWRKGLLAVCALLSLIGGVLWLVLTAAAMNGDAPTNISLATVESMVTDTDFGRLWVGRLALNLALFAAVGGGAQQETAPPYLSLIATSPRSSVSRGRSGLRSSP